MELLKRLMRILLAEAGSFRRGGPTRQFEKTSPGYEAPPKNDYGGFASSHYPRQVVEDLAVFNLTPPSSLEAVKKIRNQEMKKYHADRFFNDPERYKISQEIMQIYNAAYERLKAYYETLG